MRVTSAGVADVANIWQKLRRRKVVNARVEMECIAGYPE
jgi:hypothetical protein